MTDPKTPDGGEVFPVGCRITCGLPRPAARPKLEETGHRETASQWVKITNGGGSGGYRVDKSTGAPLFLAIRRIKPRFVLRHRRRPTKTVFRIERGHPMDKVKAAVCREFGAPLSIEEVSLAAPGPKEIRVGLAACAICHSDITFIDGGWGGHLPAVYGHEAAGTVTAVGGDVNRFAVGDTVLVTLLRSCGTCPSCLSAHPATCAGRFDIVSRPLSRNGEAIGQGLRTGAFAEAVVVDQSQIVKIPEDMPLDAAAPLSCGVITGIGAVVNTAGLRAGQTCVVIGAGGVGLNAIQGARIAGASRIVAVDMTEEKLGTALEFGATDGVLASEAKPWSAARRILGGGADFAFVTVGDVKAYDTSARYLGTHGRTVMVGMTHDGAASTYQPVIFSALAQGMIGSKMGDVVLGRDIPWMVDLYRQGRLKLDELISGRWRLDEINEAIADTRTGAARRNVIVFRG